MAWAIRNAIRESFAIETLIFIARQADSPASLEFPIRAKHTIQEVSMEPKLNTMSKTYFSQTFRAPPGCPARNPGISRQKVWFPCVSKDTPNFWAATPSRGRPPAPPEDIRTKKFGFGFLFLPEFHGATPAPSTTHTPTNPEPLQTYIGNENSAQSFSGRGFLETPYGHGRLRLRVVNHVVNVHATVLASPGWRALAL